MRILHTADWHLNDRLGRIDRTDDLRKAVERVAVHCREQNVDVLLVAGDLFSELARPDEKNKLLVAAFDETLTGLRRHPKFDPKAPAVLSAHVHVYGSQVGPSLF